MAESEPGNTFENPYPSQEFVPARTIATPLPSPPDRLIQRRTKELLVELTLTDAERESADILAELNGAE